MSRLRLVPPILFCLISPVSICVAQQPCNVLTNEAGQELQNGSRLCAALKVTDGRFDLDRSRSRLALSQQFIRRLTIPRVEAEEFVFATLANLLHSLTRPYRLALSDEDAALDDRGELNDAATNAIRTTSRSWTAFLRQFNEWAAATNRPSVNLAFSALEADAFSPLVTAHESTALLVWDDGSLDAAEGTFTVTVLDPIDNWADQSQAEILFPDLADETRKDSRRRRIIKLLSAQAGRPRCYECLKLTLEKFYQRLGLDPVLIFDDRNTSPLLIRIIESKRIVSISWLSLKDDDPNIDKILYSLMTDWAFRIFVENRAGMGKTFKYSERLGEPGPYFNAQRMQIQQLLVNQLGYAVSLTMAPGSQGTTSNYNLAIEKLSAEETEPPPTLSTNETFEAAPATANAEGVVTAHEQERKNQTDFIPERKKDPEKRRDKKRYVGGGFEFRPGQGLEIFGLGQLSRFPLLPATVNNFSAKGGSQGTDGALGNVNYFADYLLFNKLHRRLSIQLTVSSDLQSDRQLAAPNTDERRRGGLARFEFEPFRDRGGSLLRFFAEGRHDSVELKANLQPVIKRKLTMIDLGAFYFFESVERERPRRIRFEPRFRAGLGLSAGETRFNKLVVTGNFHQVLARRFEFDFGGRLELSSHQTPLFELPSLGGADVLRGFRRDDGLARKLWSVQNELWIPLNIGNDRSSGFKTLVREKVKIAPFVDVGGLYEAIEVDSGVRVGSGVGIRFIYNPIIFKFDYGYGFGNKATGGARGKFHFSLTSNLPF